MISFVFEFIKISLMYTSKVVWITGASSGIGKALALRYNKLGAFVILSARKKDTLISVQKQLSNPDNSYVQILDLEKSLVTRNFIYDTKTYKKYRITDITTKKKNSVSRFIYIENNQILSDKIGYPQFYTQLIFEKNNKNIKIKTVINNMPTIAIFSKCEKI